MYWKFVLVLFCQGALILGTSACSNAKSTRSAPDDRPTPSDAGMVEPPVSDEEPAEKVGPPVDVVSRLIQTALKSDGSLSYESLIQRLGAPQRVETAPVSNQYVEGQIDTLRTLVYAGVEALLYDVQDASKTILVRLSLSSTQYATPEGLRVGLSKERVLDLLGPPTRRDAATGKLVYRETAPNPTSMVIQLQDNRVVRIDWEFPFS